MDGLSWSLDREIASKFPFLNRYRVAKPVLITATVSKSKILALKLDRGEREVITLVPKRVSVEQLVAP